MSVTEVLMMFLGGTQIRDRIVKNVFLFYFPVASLASVPEVQRDRAASERV